MKFKYLLPLASAFFLLMAIAVYAAGEYADPTGYGVPAGYSYGDDYYFDYPAAGDNPRLDYECDDETCDGLAYFSCRNSQYPSQSTKTCIVGFNSDYPLEFTYNAVCPSSGGVWAGYDCWTVHKDGIANCQPDSIGHSNDYRGAHNDDGRMLHEDCFERLTIWDDQAGEPADTGDFSARFLTTHDVYEDGGGVILKANWGYGIPSLEITSLEDTVYVDQTVHFTATWQYLSFSPFYLYFYEDINDNVPANIKYNYPLGSSGSYTFQWSYPYPTGPGEAYSPGVRISRWPWGSGSTLYLEAVMSGSLTVQSSIALSDDSLYPSTLTVGTGTGVTVGESMNVDWDISADRCPDGFASIRLYKGYPPALKSADTGTLLLTTSGSTTLQITRSPEPYSDILYPYVVVTCNDGTKHTLYDGSTWKASEASGKLVSGQTGAILYSAPIGSVFGLSPQSFHLSPQSFHIKAPADANIALKGVVALLNTTIDQLFKLANMGYEMISQAPIFSFVNDLIAPEEGETRYLPDSFFGIDFSDVFGVKSYSIDFVETTETATPFLFFFQAIFSLGLMTYIFRNLLTR